MTTATTDLRAELLELTAERDALRAQLAGDLPQATRWLQRKVWRQAAELDRLNRRVTSQRFVLRTLAESGRSLTAEEYRAARAAIANVQLRDRIRSTPAELRVLVTAGAVARTCHHGVSAPGVRRQGSRF